MAQITYDDKDSALPTSNPRRLYRDLDANEVKDVVNENEVDFTTHLSDPAAHAAAIQSAITTAVTGLFDDRGNFDASVNAYPSSGGSGTAGAILKGDIWRISVAGILPTGIAVQAGDSVRALVDTPGNTQANWAAGEGAVPDSSETVKGIIEIATQGEVTTGTDDVRAITPLKLAVRVGLKLDSLITIQSKTAAYTLVSADLTNVNLGKNLMFVMNVATDNDFEIPLDATVDFPIGTIMGIRKIGAGITTITAVIGVTLAAPLSAFDLVNANDTAYVEKIAANSWVANGQLSL